MKDGLYFVGIKDVSNMRTSLLYSSKDIIDSLRGFQKFKELRDRKKGLILQFKSTVQEIVVLNRRFKLKMPKGYTKTATQEKRSYSQLDVLEKELEKVESRLKQLE